MAYGTVLAIASGSTGSETTSHNLGTINLQANRLYVFIAGAENWGPAQTYSISQTGATWNEITHAGGSMGATRTAAFRFLPSSNVTETLTLNVTQAARPSWTIVEVSSPIVSGSNGAGAVRQLPTVDDDGAMTDLLVNYPLAWNADSVGVFGSVCGGGAVPGTPRSGWDELFPDLTIGGIHGFNVQARTTGTDTAANCNYASSNMKSGIALEIITADGGGPPPDPDGSVFEYNFTTMVL